MMDNKPITVAMRAATILISLAAVLAVAGCRAERPDGSPQSETPARSQSAPAPTPPRAGEDTTVYIDMAERPDTGSTSTPASSAAPAGNVRTGGSPGPGWKRADLVKGVQEFVAAIDSNNQERFWSSLSQRSLSLIDRDRLAPREDIWNAARQTLSDIENRSVTVVGGSHDSVALKIDGLRLVDGSREDDPVIIHLLRESGNWKVMYPGLLYPKHHLQR